MNRTPRIAIIGGGIGGIGAARALSMRSIEVEVYESAPEIKEIGAGLDVTPNAMRVMRALGLEQAVVDIGWQAEVRIWRHWKTGEIVSRVEHKEVLQRYGAAGCNMHRADLLDVLSASLPAEVRVHLNATCVSATTEGDVASARFADGSEIEADVIIGADGIRSAVRSSLFGTSSPRFTGMVCYRTVIPVTALPDGKAVRDSGNSRGPHGLFVVYGVRRGELINVVLFHDDDGDHLESWSATCEKAEVEARYRHWHPSYQRIFDADTTWYKWPLFDREPIAQWTRGRVTLLGDAAHPMLPYLGQGAAQSLEDGFILAAALDAHRDDPGLALDAYQRVRVPRTSRMVLAARARGEANHVVSPMKAWRRDKLIALRKRFGGDPSGRGDTWIPDYDVTSPEVLAEVS